MLLLYRCRKHGHFRTCGVGRNTEGLAIYGQIQKMTVYSFKKSLTALIFKYVDLFGMFFVPYDIYLLNVDIYSQTEIHTHIQFCISYDQQFIEKKGTKIIVYRRNGAGWALGWRRRDLWRTRQSTGEVQG